MQVQTTHMELDQLLSSIDTLSSRGHWSGPVQSICYDSRQARPGSLFVAITGSHQDGHVFVEDAYNRGARAFLVQHEVQLPSNACVTTVESTRKALATVSAVHYNHPSRHMRVIGITGTNGKTTVAYLLQSILPVSYTHLRAHET